ncbi:MAG: M28 family peptidase [Alphaproteobacteria bacterium]|nr:M28 family peptidase [Alphaproteobacteria bacterium]
MPEGLRIPVLALVATCLAFHAGRAETETRTISGGTDAIAPRIEALRRHVGTLSADIGERSVVRGDGLDRAKRYLVQSFQAAGLSVNEQTYVYRGRPVANLIADLPGAPADSAPLLIGAHYDTVVDTPGADDNASGVAVLLELARWAAENRPAAAVRFVAFTLEEPPVFGTAQQGSRVFVRRLVEDGKRINGAIVLEMVGFTTPKQRYPLVLSGAGYPETGDFIGLVGNRSSRPFGEQVLRGMRRNPALPVESLFVWFNGWALPDTRLSDHASFWDSDLPAVMITDTAYFRNPHYHKPSDRAETLDYAFMAELVQSLTLVLDELAPTR